jgi:ribosomal protein S18 acetylase RimI-like enzyme
VTHPSALPPSLRRDALTLEDVPALTALVNAVDAHEELGEPAEEPSMREWMRMPRLDLASDTVAVRAGEELLGFGIVTVSAHVDRDGRARVQLSGAVHPAHRRRGLGTRILEQLETRGAVLAAERHPGAPAVLRTGGGRDPEPGAGPGGADVRPVLERRGYGRVRSWLEMERELPGETLDVPAPDDAELVTPGPERSEAVRAAHIAAFADHWGSAPIDAETWQLWTTSHTSRPEHCTVALAADGTVLAYALTSEDRPGVLHVALVGTRPEARGRGLARAVLARTLASAAGAGFTGAVLEVDAESLTGATRLYEAVGFHRAHVYATYEKPLG